MKEKVLNAYQPPEHFEEVGQLPPVVQEAADDNTELWLIRFPANEVEHLLLLLLLNLLAQSLIKLSSLTFSPHRNVINRACVSAFRVELVTS